MFVLFPKGSNSNFRQRKNSNHKNFGFGSYKKTHPWWNVVFFLFEQCHIHSKSIASFYACMPSFNKFSEVKINKNFFKINFSFNNIDNISSQSQQKMFETAPNNQFNKGFSSKEKNINLQSIDNLKSKKSS